MVRKSAMSEKFYRNIAIDLDMSMMIAVPDGAMINIFLGDLYDFVDACREEEFPADARSVLVFGKEDGGRHARLDVTVERYTPFPLKDLADPAPKARPVADPHGRVATNPNRMRAEWLDAPWHQKTLAESIDHHVGGR